MKRHASIRKSSVLLLEALEGRLLLNSGNFTLVPPLDATGIPDEGQQRLLPDGARANIEKSALDSLFIGFGKPNSFERGQHSLWWPRHQALDLREAIPATEGQEKLQKVIDRLVQRLGDDDIKVRDKIQAEFGKMVLAAPRALKAASGHPDPERSARAQAMPTAVRNDGNNSALASTNGQDQDDPKQEKLEDLIRDLGDDDIQTRDRAETELTRRGKMNNETGNQTVEALQNALGSKDAEVVGRASHILKTIAQEDAKRYRQQGDDLVLERQRHEGDAERYRRKAKDYEDEAEDLKKAGEDDAAKEAYKRAAAARKKAGDEEDKAQQALNDEREAYKDADDADKDGDKDDKARKDRQKRADERDNRQKQRNQ